MSLKRAKTRRGQQHMEGREPKIHENPKSILYVHGTRCSQLVQSAFKDLHSMTRGQSKIFSRKRELRPMDDCSVLESMSSKLDVSLFVVGTSNKKRPNAMTFVRMFNHHLLDMAEVTVEKFTPLHAYKGVEKPAATNKPALIFVGHCWDHSLEFKTMKSLLADTFRGPIVDNIFLAGIDRVIMFAAEEPKIVMKQYRILLKKSGTKLPLVELVECGPSMEMTIGRVQFAAEDLMREALRQPKELRPKKVKNIEYSALGDKMGRVHMQSQDLGTMQTRKMKGLKKGKRKSGDVDRDSDGEQGAAATSDAE
eukprot:m.357453 g.357453  ORF g.357453 m.357453 type:complete len:309 (-) comp17838_c0_seq1:347-1273(-)